MGPVGSVIPTAGTFGFTSLKTSDPGQIPLAKRWFQCRYCTVIHVGKEVRVQPVGEERASCFAHQAMCPKRPADTPVTEIEREAVEQVCGAMLRERLDILDTMQREMAANPNAPSDELAAIERSRGAWRAALAELGLRID